MECASGMPRVTSIQLYDNKQRPIRRDPRVATVTRCDRNTLRHSRRSRNPFPHAPLPLVSRMGRSPFSFYCTSLRASGNVYQVNYKGIAKLGLIGTCRRISMLLYSASVLYNASVLQEPVQRNLLFMYHRFIFVI